MYLLIQYGIVINGIYDILSSIGVLCSSIMGVCHTSMFISKNEERDRWMAYFVFTYGCMRVSMIYPYWTYLLEALCVYNEAYVNRTIVPWKGAFVISSSVLLAYASAY